MMMFFGTVVIDLLETEQETSSSHIGTVCSHLLGYRTSWYRTRGTRYGSVPVPSVPVRVMVPVTYSGLTTRRTSCLCRRPVLSVGFSNLRSVPVAQMGRHGEYYRTAATIRF